MCFKKLNLDKLITKIVKLLRLYSIFKVKYGLLNRCVKNAPFCSYYYLTFPISWPNSEEF